MEVDGVIGSTSKASVLEREKESGWEEVIGEEVGREKASCVDNAILRRALSFGEDEEEKRLANQFIDAAAGDLNDDDGRCAGWRVVVVGWEGWKRRVKDARSLAPLCGLLAFSATRPFLPKFLLSVTQTRSLNFFSDVNYPFFRHFLKKFSIRIQKLPSPHGNIWRFPTVFLVTGTHQAADK